MDPSSCDTSAQITNSGNNFFVQESGLFAAGTSEFQALLGTVHGTYISGLLLFIWEQIGLTLHVSGTEDSLTPTKLSCYLGETPNLCLFPRVSIPKRATLISKPA